MVEEGFGLKAHTKGHKRDDSSSRDKRLELWQLTRRVVGARCCGEKARLAPKIQKGQGGNA